MKHSKRYMHSHNLRAHLWYKLQQLGGKYMFKIFKNFQKEVVQLYISMIKVFCNCLGQ